jgi:hypothetical protein
MKNQSQRNFIKRVLRDKGEVSRNFALSQFISRLGAIICDLRKEGWEFDIERRNGDYVYKLKQAPIIRKVVLVDGRAVEVTPEIITPKLW